jgi:hypothetical protein
VSESLPAAELVLAGHDLQLVAPCTSEYDPASHGSQLPDPVAALYVPAAHAEHAIPSDDAVYPALHEQSVSVSLPAAELVLAGHAVHSCVPFVSL